MEGEYLINDREPIEIYHFFEDISFSSFNT